MKTLSPMNLGKPPGVRLIKMAIGLCLLGALAACGHSSLTPTRTATVEPTLTPTARPTPNPTPTSTPTPTPIPVADATCTLKASQFSIVDKALSIDPENNPGTNIPRGSVIYHWANGITEVDGSDGSCLLVASDDASGYVGTPDGKYQPATQVLFVPVGGTTVTDQEGDEEVTRWYLAETLTVTVVRTTRDYPYA